MGQLVTIDSNLDANISAPPVKHYQAYWPKPFTREQREETTLLFGGLTWKHERMMQGALHNLKYKAEPLPNIAREDLDAGKELIDVGACCPPTIFTTGSLVNFLKKEVAQHGKDEVNKSSCSSNTNEIMWGAKVATRCPWITCVVRLSSYECGMDQPTYTPAQKIVEATGTLYFKFGDLDSTKPAGGIKIRVETISHYLGKYSQEIIQRKLMYLSPNCPLMDLSAVRTASRAAMASGASEVEHVAINVV